MQLTNKRTKAAHRENRGVRWDRIRTARKAIEGGLYESERVADSTLQKLLKVLFGSKR